MKNKDKTSEKVLSEPLHKADVMQSVILAQELRNKNFINYIGKPICVGYKTIWAISKTDNDSFMYRPIPLTEEWLLKFGFRRFPWGLVVDDLLFKDDLKCSYLTLQVGNGFEVTINYVHQLQNLFFSLTGRELTVA